jgi:hypothetical protein
MPEPDTLTDALRDLAELDARRPDLATVRHRVRAALAAELTDPPRRSPRRRRLTRPGSLPGATLAVTLASAVVTAAVIAVVLVAQSHHSVAVRGPAAPPAPTTSPLTTPLPSRPSRRLLIREDSREHYRAPRRLLSAFTAFDRGHLPRTLRGATLSRPPLSALPDSVLQTADPRRRNHIDVDEIRQVRLRSGVEVWILPGTRSLCLVAGLPNRSRRRRGGNEGCGPIAQAISHSSIGGTTTRAAGWFSYGIIPRGHHLATVQVGPVSRRVHPAFGVYGIVVRRHR